MIVKMWTHGLGIISCVEFSIKDNSSKGDAELLRAAAEWLDGHPDACLNTLSIHDNLDLDNPVNKLSLFVEDAQY